MPEERINTVGGNGTFDDVIAQATPEIQTLARCRARTAGGCDAGRNRGALGATEDRRLRRWSQEDVRTFLLYRAIQTGT